MAKSKDLVYNGIHAVILLDLLTERGIERVDALRGTHLNYDALQDLDQYITFKQYCTLLRNGLELTGDPLLGIQLGKRLNITGHGELGMAAFSARNFFEFLQLIARFNRIIAPFTAMTVEDSDSEIALRIEFTVPVGDLLETLEDTALGIYTSVAQMIFPGEIEGISFTMQSEKPDNVDQYLAEVPYTIEWGQACQRVRVTRELALRKLSMSNPTAVRHYEEKMQNFISRLYKKSEAFLPRLRKVISAEPGNIPTLEQAAEQLHMSARTLNRRLQEIGTSYKELVAEVRRDLALDYLRTSEHSIEEISDLLGYSNPSNFGKAFKTWTGYSPSQYPLD